MRTALTTQASDTPIIAITICPTCGHDVDLHSPITLRCVVVTRKWSDGLYTKRACRCEST